MKHLITLWLLVVALFVGVTTFEHSKSKIMLPKYRITSSQLKSMHENHQSNFNAYKLLLKHGMRNARTRQTNSFKHISFKSLLLSSKTFRIKHTTRIELQKYITGYTQYLSKSAIKKTDGHYLYSFQKLLI